MEDDLGPPPNTRPPLVRNDAAPPPERVTINGNIYPVIYLQLVNGNYARHAVIDGTNRLIVSDDNGQRVQMDDQTFVQVTPVNLAAALNNMPQVPGANIGGRRRSRRTKRSKSRRSRRV